MPNLTLFKWLSFLLSLFYLTGNVAQAQVFCGTSHQDTSSSPGTIQPRGPNANCNNNSTVFQGFFRKKENYIPYSGNPHPAKVLKKVKMKFYVINPGTTTKQNYNSSDYSYFVNVVQSMNEQMANITQPNVPPAMGCENNICHIQDAKIRFELAGVDFSQHKPELTTASESEMLGTPYQSYFDSFHDDSIINVFFIRTTAISYNGYAIGAYPKFDFHRRQLIRMYNDFHYNHWPHRTASILIHEFGHEIDLGHTAPYSDCNTSNEDHLFDIYGTGASRVCPVPDYNSSPNLDTFRNDYMMQWHFPAFTYLSPMQMGLFHRACFVGALSKYSYPIEAPDVSPWEITSSQTWNFSIRMYQNIIVKSGNTLTLTCELQMPPEGKIIVEKGAKLVLDGGTISSYHPKASWRGIELYGDPNATPYAANQGSFEMKNQAMIEYAMDGVRDFLNNIWNGGGIISISNSTFKDCRRAVELNHYPNYARGASCSFSNVTFLTENPDAPTNQSYPGPGQFTSYNERGVLISGCTFEDRITLGNIANIKNRHHAIYTCDAGFRVQNSTFKGYKTGVATTTVFNHPGRSVRLMNNDFDTVHAGIMLANNFAHVQDNEFNNLIGYVYNSGQMTYLREGEALFMDNASGINIVRNIINGDNMAIRGITASDTRLYGARLIDNTLNGTRLGVITQRRNPTLDILCNHFEGGFANILANPQSTHPFYTLKNQGNGCVPNQYRAGNTFSGSVPYHIASYLSNNWSYYYLADDLNQVPNNTSGTFFNNGCAGLGAEDPNSQCDLPGNVESWIDKFLDEAFTQWPTMAPGQQLGTEGLLQLSGIIAALSEQSTSDSLIEFLHSINNNESRKMLLPLLLEAGDYGAFDDKLNEIAWDDDVEKASFENYYGILKSLSEEGRQLWQLSTEELEMIQTIASEGYEHAAFARALLEFAYGQEWHHYQEQLPALPSSYIQPGIAIGNSQLHDAVPNPAGSSTRIEIQINKEDAAKAYLVLSNMMGHEVYRSPLTEGINSVDISLDKFAAGVYIYSFISKGRIVASKRLAVVK